MQKLFNEEFLIYILCVLSYVLLIRVVFQYYEIINDVYYKPDKVLLYLLYTSELIFIFLFTPVFTLKNFGTIEKQISETHIKNVWLNSLINKKLFFGIIVKAFILLSMFHIIVVFATRNNSYFSYQSFFVVLFLLSVFLFFLIAYTLFLIVLTRNLCLSIVVSYFTIISIFGCLFFITPLIDIVDNPTPIINLTMDINPMLAISSATNLSLFRLGPFREVTNFEGFDYTYPHWAVHLVSYFILSILFFIGTFSINALYLKNKKAVN